jgi:hypothetical protein
VIVDVQWLLIVVGGSTLLMLGGLVWLRAQQQAAIDRLDDRMAHLLAGVSLLTDTTEGALRDVALEINRLASLREDEDRPRVRAAAQRRMATAARLGRAVQDIAAAEQVSEGEVRLRVQLEKARKERSNYAAMR